MSPGFSFVVFQEEIAPTTGTRHFQGFLHLAMPYQRSNVIKRIKDVTKVHVHVEPAHSIAGSIAYCTKESTRHRGPWQAGHAPREVARAVRPAPAPAPQEGGGQGFRSDLEAFKNAVLAGADDMVLMSEHLSIMARYPNLHTRIRAAFDRGRDAPPEVHVYYGAPGTGKSRRAHELAPDAYRKMSGMWWDLYQGEPDVIMDDFYGTNGGNRDMVYQEFLKLTDRYNYMAQVKGSTVKVNPKRIFITSNQHPSMWYSESKEYVPKAFFRRISSITEFLENGETREHLPADFF